MPLETWGVRFTQEAVYRTDTQWQAESIVDFERPLPHNLFFRTGVDGLWMANTDGYFYTLGCSLRHAISSTHALEYAWSNSFQTRPSYILTEVAFRVTYRHDIWRKWLFFEVTPQVRYPADRNFVATPGILFRFEMFFGSKE